MSDNTGNLVRKIKKDPFHDDCLNRKPFVKKISNILVNSDGKDVFSLEASFGAGKTVLNHRLKSYIENNKELKTKCIYVNVWESDFYNSPLIPIIDEISNSFRTWKGEATKVAIKKLKDNGKELLKKSLWQGGKILANSVTPGLGGVVDLIKGGVEGINSDIEVQEEVYREYRELKQLKTEFVKSLSVLAKKRKLIIIIDELDRCRPDYAIETLEVIKHFFEAKNVTFLLSINKEQLASSVKCIYGLEHQCFDDYLRKFVDFSIKLPEPNNKEFAKYLYDKSNLKKYKNKSVLFSGGNKGNGRYVNEYGFIVSEMFKILSDGYAVSLRIQEQIFSKICTFVSSLEEGEYFIPELHIPLLFTLDRSSEDYEKLKINEREVFVKKVKYEGSLLQKFRYRDYGQLIDKTFYPFYELLYVATNYDENKLYDNDFYQYNRAENDVSMGDSTFTLKTISRIKYDIINAFNKIEFIEEISSK